MSSERVKKFTALPSKNSFSYLETPVPSTESKIHPNVQKSGLSRTHEVVANSPYPIASPADAAFLGHPQRQAAVAANLKLSCPIGKAKTQLRSIVSSPRISLCAAAPMEISSLEVISPGPEQPLSEPLIANATMSDACVLSETPDPLPVLSSVTVMDDRDRLIIALFAEIDALKAIVQGLTSNVQVINRRLSPPDTRQINSYADIATVSCPPPSKRIKESTAASRAEQVVNQLTHHKIRRFLGDPPARTGIRIVHIDGYRHIRSESPAVLSSILEVKFNFPRRHVLNVSVVTERLVEVVIDADSHDLLKSCLQDPLCPLTLIPDLDVSVPLHDHKTAEEAKLIFDRRLTREITRLQTSPRPALLRVGKLLAAYKADISVRSLLPRPRPTPTYMSAFLLNMDTAATAPEISADMTQ